MKIESLVNKLIDIIKKEKWNIEDFSYDDTGISVNLEKNNIYVNFEYDTISKTFQFYKKISPCFFRLEMESTMSKINIKDITHDFEYCLRHTEDGGWRN